MSDTNKINVDYSGSNPIYNLDGTFSGVTFDGTTQGINRCYLEKGHEGDHQNDPNLVGNTKYEYEMCNYELVYLSSWVEMEDEQ